MKFLSDLDLHGKRVLYRVDINSSVQSGVIADDNRLRAIMPGIEQMLKMGAKQIILLAHQGRPGNEDGEFSLAPHARRLEKLLGKKVAKLDSCRECPPEGAQLVMLENLRLDDETEADDQKRLAFAEVLAGFGDVYVNDAFGVCHRHHTSIVELPKLMKEKAAGLLLEKEVKSLQPLLEEGNIKHPFTLIIGGAKIDTKIGIIKQFLHTVTHVLVGGGIANTFLHAEGFDTGQSLREADKAKVAREIAIALDGKKDGLVLPIDVVCADRASDATPAIDIPVEDVMGDMKIFDIGQKTAAKYAQLIEYSKTVIWNGPLGLAEKEHFRHGSEAIARAMAHCHGKTIIGGGESVALINQLEIP
ncbi:MAG: phosphoglycerate kinase, partial [bacterium]|nr:phosphoglycerate kinase [bacterium]